MKTEKQPTIMPDAGHYFKCDSCGKPKDPKDIFWFEGGGDYQPGWYCIQWWASHFQPGTLGLSFSDYMADAELAIKNEEALPRLEKSQSAQEHDRNLMTIALRERVCILRERLEKAEALLEKKTDRIISLRMTYSTQTGVNLERVCRPIDTETL